MSGGSHGSVVWRGSVVKSGERGEARERRRGEGRRRRETEDEQEKGRAEKRGVSVARRIRTPAEPAAHVAGHRGGGEAGAREWPRKEPERIGEGGSSWVESAGSGGATSSQPEREGEVGLRCAGTHACRVGTGGGSTRTT